MSGRCPSCGKVITGVPFEGCYCDIECFDSRFETLDIDSTRGDRGAGALLAIIPPSLRPKRDHSKKWRRWGAKDAGND